MNATKRREGGAKRDIAVRIVIGKYDDAEFQALPVSLLRCSEGL
jgi:hypothetical protein